MLTEALKNHLVEQGWVKEDATDEEFQSVVQEKLKSKELAGDKYAELIQPKSDRMAEIKTAVAETARTTVEEILDKRMGQGEPKEPETKSEPETETDYQKMKSEILAELQEKAKGGDGASAPSSYEITKRMTTVPADGSEPKVKNPLDDYAHTPTAVVQKKGPNAGKPCMHNGKEVNHQTPRRSAMTHAWMKFLLFPEALTDRDKAIAWHILHKEPFLSPDDPGSVGSRVLNEREAKQVFDNTLAKGHYDHDRFAKVFSYEPTGFGIPVTKALIDDSTSGGENAIPEFFDEQVIILPILGGEVSPLVHVVDVPRGVAAQGFQMGNPTIAAANTEGSAVSLFNTSSFVSNHDTSFFRAAGFMELGRNFTQDAVPGIVDNVLERYRRVVQEWLDEQIVNGDGTTEPQGILQASGIITVTPDTPTTGPVDIQDIVDMFFGVSKAFRQESRGMPTLGYIFNDARYKSFRALQVGTSDDRLIFGTDDLSTYQFWGNVPVAIEENGMANTNGIFANFGGYTLYRRQGPRVIREDRGDTLVRRNTILVGIDVRFGGQLDRGGFASVVTEFPSTA